MSTLPRRCSSYWLLLIAILLVALVYWPGLYGGWLFDDYPNIVDNPGVQPHQPSIAALVSAALSSPASDFKRPLSSLTFAANYLVSGLDPWAWKLTNLLLHVANGVLVFFLARGLLRCARRHWDDTTNESTPQAAPQSVAPSPAIYFEPTNLVAVLICATWMLLPINLTAVLYVVQREESLANLFVLLGLIGYIYGRLRMLVASDSSTGNDGWQWYGFALCTMSLILPTAIGLLAKETAVMLPLYALLIEWIVFQFRRPGAIDAGRDGRIAALFIVFLLLPMVLGLAWLLPHAFSASTWATRGFTLRMRLLSEARIVCDYIAWTLLPTPHALSFYHDQYHASTGLLSPWTTLASILGLAALAALAYGLRQRQPLVALGIGLYLGCHLLTGTILPLELVYEHRNYFASFGVLLAVVPLLAAMPSTNVHAGAQRRAPPLAWPRRALLACLLLWWGGLTAMTAGAWSDSLRLAQELAARAMDSPRAQYELGRTYIIYSHYDPASPYTRLAYAPLERAAALPDSSILPQQALIFMNSRMRVPVEDSWWTSMVQRLRSTDPTVQDESSLQALMQCKHDQECDFSTEHLNLAFQAALSHPNPSARLLSMYGDYAWNDLSDRALGERMIAAAVKKAPNEPAYLITWTRMLIAQNRLTDAHHALQQLDALNVGGHLSSSIEELQSQLQDKPK